MPSYYLLFAFWTAPNNSSSSKVALSGLWMGPNSAVSLRKSFWIATKKESKNTLDDCNSYSEVMFIGVVNTEDKDWVETVNFGSIQGVFKLDNGAQCNVLPIWPNYIKTVATILGKIRNALQNFIRPVGKYELPCWVREERYQICFQVFDRNYMPLLGRSSRENMGLIQGINAIERGSILNEFPEVFQGLECLPGKYHIGVDPLCSSCGSST